MKKCKYCGEKFYSKPIKCIKCGAENNFLIDVLHNEKNKYDDLISIFLNEKDLNENKFNKNNDNKTKKKYIKKEDEEYYDFLEKKLNKKNIEMNFFKSNFNKLKNKNLKLSEEETTFNGIFNKENTLENTFFKKNKTGNIYLKKEKELNKNKNIRKKLLNILIYLISIFLFLIFCFVFLINNIANKNTEKNSLPDNYLALSFFENIKSIKEEDFLNNPGIFIFDENNDLEKEENKEYLKKFYFLIKQDDYKIKKIKKIESKGMGRSLITYEIKGNNFAVSVLKNLLLKKNKKGKYLVDLNDFIRRYDRIKNIENSLLK